MTAAALERRARKIAAEKMGLVKDPEGANLPEDLWRLALPQAEREIEVQRGRRPRFSRSASLT